MLLLQVIIMGYFSSIIVRNSCFQIKLKTATVSISQTLQQKQVGHLSQGLAYQASYLAHVSYGENQCCTLTGWHLSAPLQSTVYHVHSSVQRTQHELVQNGIGCKKDN